MKAIIGLLFAILSFTSSAKNLVLNSGDLSKYSYTLMGISAKDFTEGTTGTGFFIKKNGNLYLVTARHTFYACDPGSNEWKPLFDYNLLDLGSGFTPLVIQIPATYGKCKDEQKGTDLLIIKMDTALAARVNSVEDFMLPGFEYVDPAEVHEQSTRTDSLPVGFGTQHNIQIGRNFFTGYNIPIYQRPDGPHDTVLYTIEDKSLKVDQRPDGFSGSPLFVQDERSKKWRLGGIVTRDAFSDDQNNGAITVIKPRYIEETIDKMK